MTDSAERMPESMRWYKWDPGRFAASKRVKIMTAIQELAHRRMLDIFWIDGALPNDDVELEIICQGDVDITDIRRVLQLSWNETSLGWTNSVIEELREEALEIHAKKSRGGKKAAENRATARALRDKRSTAAKGSKTPATVLVDTTKSLRTESTKTLRTGLRTDGEVRRTTTTLESEKPPTEKNRDSETDVILVRNGLKWGEIQHPAKLGYKKITREYFEDVMFATKEDLAFPENLVIETMVAEVTEMVQRGRKAQEGVDEIMADANRNTDLAMLEGARRRLTELDMQRSETLEEIADLTMKLGLTASERRNWA